MSEVKLNEGESFDSLIRRFTKRVQGDSILAEIRKRKYFEPPTSVRKRRLSNKKRKSVRTTLKNA